MHFSLFDHSKSQTVISLFTNVFSASEGVAEGQVIGNLVSNLITQTSPNDLISCVAMDNDSIVGCIFFSRLIVPSGQTAFILSPVAISTKRQGMGIGQQLIHFGLHYLESLQISLVFTYGDPAYYGKTGFQPISETHVKAPYPLSQPEGWLAQSLDGEAIPIMQGSVKCVKALSDPKYW